MSKSPKDIEKELFSKEEVELLDKRLEEDPMHLGDGQDYNFYIKSKAWHDHDFFYRFFLSHYMRDKENKYVPSPFFHKELRDYMDETSTISIISRGHGKSTMNKMRYIRRICFGLDDKVMFCMSKSLSQGFLDEIRLEFETNDMISKVFGQLVPSKRKMEERGFEWSRNKLSFINGYQIFRITKDSPVRGHRFDEIWIDDPEEDKDVENPEMAEKFRSFVFSSIFPTLHPWGRMHITGTIIGENCLVAYLYDNENYDHWKKTRYNAMRNMERDNEGVIKKADLLWPERYDLNYFELKRREMADKNGDDSIFFQEYMNVPRITKGSQVFKGYEYQVTNTRETVNDFQFFCDIKEAFDESVVIGIDLSGGKEGNDYQAVSVRRRDGKLICTYRGYCDQEQLVDKITWLFDLGIRGLVIPEANMATAFLLFAKDTYWFNRYMYMQENDGSANNLSSDSYGFHMSKKTKEFVVNNYRALMRETSERLEKYKDSEENRIVNVSRQIYDEIQNYYYDGKGGMNARVGHDDLLMADMIACTQLNKSYIPEVLPSLKELGFIMD